MIYNDFVLDSCDNHVKVGCERLKNNLSLLMYCRPDKEYPLLQFAFNNDWTNFVDYFIDNYTLININSQDLLGNTALIIASMKGHKDFIDLLVFLNADVTIKNNDGWSAIQESISYGNIGIVGTLTKLYRIQNQRRNIERISLNKNSREFILDFTWEVKTWVPVISKYLPSDKCRITKSGSKLRFDSTLSDFRNSKWCRGNISCIINPSISSKDNPNQIFLLNNDRQLYQIIPEYYEKDLRKEIFFLMTSEIVESNVDFSNVAYVEKSRFWRLKKHPVIEKVGNYEAKMYEINNVKVSSRLRQEHMNKDQITKNKALRDKIQLGKIDILESLEIKFSDIKPPPISVMTWEEYKESMLSHTPVVLGRQPLIKNTKNNLNFSIGMSDEFPLEITEILDVLEMVLPSDKLKRLRDICATNIPPGFPVTIEIPMITTVSTIISFTNAQVADDNLKIDDQLFMIPDDYTLVTDVTAKNTVL